MTKIGHLVRELPVSDLEIARSYYCDKLGFNKAWALPEIAAVSRNGDAAIFFRLSSLPITPQSHWIYAEDLDGTFAEMQMAGAMIVEPLSVKPWGMRQFTVRDPDGHQFHVHHDR
ncbi:MAG: VOC family protein [Verrucomicrobia bacterium]|nr:VOC family protein [Verrucomicrobiota bacterium]